MGPLSDDLSKFYKEELDDALKPSAQAQAKPTRKDLIEAFKRQISFFALSQDSSKSALSFTATLEPNAFRHRCNVLFFKFLDPKVERDEPTARLFNSLQESARREITEDTEIIAFERGLGELIPQLSMEELEKAKSSLDHEIILEKDKKTLISSIENKIADYVANRDPSRKYPAPPGSSAFRHRCNVLFYNLLDPNIKRPEAESQLFQSLLNRRKEIYQKRENGEKIDNDILLFERDLKVLKSKLSSYELEKAHSALERHMIPRKIKELSQEKVTSPPNVIRAEVLSYLPSVENKKLKEKEKWGKFFDVPSSTQSLTRSKLYETCDEILKKILESNPDLYSNTEFFSKHPKKHSKRIYGIYFYQSYLSMKKAEE